jgi:predicted tellurium resistance membrane protein TerC
MADALALLLLLFGLEIVLNVDNILVISIFVGKLPEYQRKTARLVGLLFALVARIIFIAVIVKLANLRDPIIYQFSVRDMILLSGGLFLLWKAVTEIHSTVELKEGDITQYKYKISTRFVSVISQIVILDIVFSIDSVITAVGLTSQIWVIISAVILSFVAILCFSTPIGDFILKHTSIKILALAFLVTVGVTIFMEGLHESLPKEYIYLPMGFALLIELLQMRHDRNKKKKLGTVTEQE